jgi:4,5-DOPA dioxygenase extradiol
MDRKQFLKWIAGAAIMTSLSGFRKFTDELAEQDLKMPVLFVGHGSPMNAIEDNEFSKRWRQMAQEIPKPTAALIISAHWLTRGTFLTAMEKPKTIHDFGGFPKALFDIEYPASGSPALARHTAALIKSTSAGLDHDWGLDHGAWSILRQMYPDAHVPTVQLSIDYYQPAQFHYDLGRELAALRKKGVLIIGSGNMVHNLYKMRLDGSPDELNKEFGYDWAIEMNHIFKQKIADRDHQALVNYSRLNKSAELAIPTPDHYYPLLYTLALQEKSEETTFFNDKAVGGSITMTSVKIS